MEIVRVSRNTFPGDILVSTVLLPSYTGAKEYETMIFGLWEDEYQVRYPTLKAARKGHEKACAKVRKEIA
jgi:hypothetical protein